MRKRVDANGYCTGCGHLCGHTDKNGLPQLICWKCGDLEPSERTMDKKALLEKAIELTTGDRQQQHGSAKENFDNIADLWRTYILGTHGNDIAFAPGDIAAMMVLVKISRLMNTHNNMDNWIDIAGYAACGAEVVSQDK